MTTYSRPFTVRFRGAVLAELMSWKETVANGDKAINTMSKGMAGHSDGPTMVRCSGESAIPAAGFEQDFAQFCADHTDVEFSVRAADKETTYFGRITEVNSESSADGMNKVDFSFEGRIVSRIDF